MPIIGNVGRRSLNVRALNIGIHLILLVGSITMLYPFMIMISGSVKSQVDSDTMSLWPEYFHNDDMLFRKFVEARYNESSAALVRDYHGRFTTFKDVHQPAKIDTQRAHDWTTFLQQQSDTHTQYDYVITEQYGRGVYPRNNRLFRDTLKAESDASLTTYNTTYNATILSWDEVRVDVPNILSTRFTTGDSAIQQRYRAFQTDRPLWNRQYPSLDGDFVERELKPVYQSTIAELNKTLGTDFRSWSEIHLARSLPNSPLAKHWTHYVRHVLNSQHVRADSQSLASWQNTLSTRYADISMLNKTYATHYENFAAVPLPDTPPTGGAWLTDWTWFIAYVIEAQHLTVTSVEFDYRDWVRKAYTNDLAAYAAAHQLGHMDLATVPLSKQVPTLNETERHDWLTFVSTHVSPDRILLSPSARSDFIAFAATLFPDDAGSINLAAFNAAYDTTYIRVADIYPSQTVPQQTRYKKDWSAFVQQHASPHALTLQGNPQADWADYLETTHTSVSRLNQAYGLLPTSFESVTIDNWAIDHAYFQAHRDDIFSEFTSRNYRMVLDVMLFNGRAVSNTLIYCFLAIFTALLVNPLAAYAMSRFKLPSSYKIIMFLMMTMAFPPMVMGIPSFLLLKNLGMLNTFWALILPAAADGYFIFLLKGFFDSLPRELFECATLDGASEPTIFWRIAMSLSKPIMAVIALGAFNAAYRNFMLAFIVCQDSEMWTIMVHIYQLMQRSSQGVGFAALVIAAVPVFLVFVFCQNIIIRGIVVPSEK